MKTVCFVHIILLLWPASMAVAQKKIVTGATIMAQSEQKLKAKTEKTTYTMELVDKKGGVRSRTMEIYYKHLENREATLVKFTEPSNVRAVGMLILDRGTGVNDIWSYMPATRRVRRISGHQKSNWFMGSEFTYEDFEDYQLPVYTFTLLETRLCRNDRECYVVEALPKTSTERKSSGYAKKIYWIDKATNYPIRIELFNKQRRLWKTLFAEGVRVVAGYARPTVLTMHNLENERRTRLVEVARVLDGELDDYYVTQRFLRSE